VTHPYGSIIADEVARAEADLTAFRSRALTVVTTSAGVVALLTGLVTFAASASEEDQGLSTSAVVLAAIALAAFVAAGAVAMTANVPRTITWPDADDLADCTTESRWSDGEPESEHQRVVAEVLVEYLRSLRLIGGTTALLLTLAIALQVAGLAVASIAAVITMNRL
jgi:hypothetical protein